MPSAIAGAPTHRSPSGVALGEDIAIDALETLRSKLCDSAAVDPAAIDAVTGPARNTALLLYWCLHRQDPRLKALADGISAAAVGDEEALAEACGLGEKERAHASMALQMATKLLMQSQMLIPQQRWIQATLAVARASGLIANSLWSHTDAASLEAQSTVRDDY